MSALGPGHAVPPEHYERPCRPGIPGRVGPADQAGARLISDTPEPGTKLGQGNASAHARGRGPPRYGNHPCEHGGVIYTIQRSIVSAPFDGQPKNGGLYRGGGGAPAPVCMP